MKRFEMQNLTAIQRIRIAAMMGLGMLAFVVLVRLFVPLENDAGIWTRTLSGLALAWFVFFAKADSFIQRHIFWCGMVLSA
ncbi:MAG: hypothetical protein ACE37D_15100, partial [Pseudomonadales bacterium]